MANRREFLRNAAVLSSAPLASRAFSKVDSIPALDIVIYDRRYPEARRFGAFAAGLGVQDRAIEGDITDLWKGELLPRWRSSSPAAVAGLTERPALFLLERLAWDHGLRVVFEAEHELGSQGQARHHVLRSADAALRMQLQGAREGWPLVLADTLLLGGRQVPTRDFHPTEAALFAHLEEATKLYSWIIAPRSAVRG